MSRMEPRNGIAGLCSPPRFIPLLFLALFLTLLAASAAPAAETLKVPTLTVAPPVPDGATDYLGIHWYRNAPLLFFNQPSGQWADTLLCWDSFPSGTPVPGYTYPGEVYVEVPQSIPIAASGDHGDRDFRRLFYWADDRAGNVSTASYHDLYVDETKPTATVSMVKPSTMVHGKNAYVYFTYSDKEADAGDRYKAVVQIYKGTTRRYFAAKNVYTTTSPKNFKIPAKYMPLKGWYSAIVHVTDRAGNRSPLAKKPFLVH